jgi:serine/threonine protein kinase
MYALRDLEGRFYVDGTYSSFGRVVATRAQTVVLGNDHPGGPSRVLRVSFRDCADVAGLAEVAFRNIPHVVSGKWEGQVHMPDGSTASATSMRYRPFDLEKLAPQLTLHNYLLYVADVLAGLEGLHAQGSTHADVTPSNVLVDIAKNGTTTGAYLTDLECAVVDPRRHPHWNDFPAIVRRYHGRRFRLIRRCGTPAYMTPEQAQGNRPTPATDIHAVGQLVYSKLAGRRFNDDLFPVQELLESIAFMTEGDIEFKMREIKEPPGDYRNFEPVLRRTLSLRRCVRLSAKQVRKAVLDYAATV